MIVRIMLAFVTGGGFVNWSSWSCAQDTKPVAGEIAEENLGVHGYADSQGTKIHFVTKGSGPLVVMIHGFPDFWYTWRNQIPALAENHTVVAIDQRGYNWSDQPEGIDAYQMERLVDDVRAVVRHFEQDQAIIVGHDWGGMVAWQFAMRYPDITSRLVVLNLPHPNGLRRELATNEAQQKNSAYARFFQTADAGRTVQADALVRWVKDPEAKAKHLEAMKRSSMEGMLNYYKANYPREPYTAPTEPGPRVQCPVLMFHGLKDQALLADGLNGTWQWLDRELTLVTIPDADHFVQHDAPDLVTRTMVKWLQP
jgi:pimeloyl-ACP methyl ester carboxylesterase